MVCRLQRWADTNVTLAFEDNKYDTDNTDDTDDIEDSDDTDNTDDTDGTDDTDDRYFTG